MIGQTISHYKILEKLGEGGMGIVYKAHDTTLNRTVALKFLPDRINKDETAKARFLQEAQAAAGLNHACICTIYGVEDHEGSLSIAMEYVDGGTLRDFIAARKPTIDNTIQIAIQVGEALAEAHGKGIVHRDIKSDNIMLTSKGQAKVMDFGLAKLKGALKLTRTSSTVGTLAYMAPEQIQGGEADARSDLFAFGVLLFEMITGTLPFRGEHEAAMMYSILHEQPDQVQKYVPEISTTCESIIAKALEKNPEERYQSAADMVADLRRWKRDSSSIHRRPVEPPRVSSSTAQVTASDQRGPSMLHPNKRWLLIASIGAVVIVSGLLLLIHPWSKDVSDRKMLVVLPFENQSDSTREYFADGLTDEITTRLSGLSGLGVIARSSAKNYKGTKKSIKEMSSELGVDYMLMGTVRWSGSQVRVSPELIKASTGVQMWAQTLDAPFSDVFTLQSDIASKVASALDVKLLKPEAASLGQKLTTNAEAYDYYLRGVAYLERSDLQADHESGIRLLERATQLDPQFAAAYAKISYAHSNMYWFFYDRSEARIEQCRKAVEKALALNPDLSAAHEAMAWYYYHAKLDYANALKEFSVALRLQPNNTDVSYGMAAVFRRQGRMRESIEAFRKAVAGNPRSADLVRQLGETLMLGREYEEADQVFARTIDLAPDLEEEYLERAENLILWKGDLATAQKIIDEGLSISTLRQNESLSPVDLTVAAMREDFPAAERAVGRIKGATLDNQFVFCPSILLLAQIEELKGAHTKAEAHFDSARVMLERRVRATPDDERIHSALGIAYAGLGRASEAVKEGERGVALLPVEKDTWRGSFRLGDLAHIYAMVGDKDKAIDVLQRLISIPSEFSATYIRLDPKWKSLRGNKRFEALVKP
jgi:serine/threonine protein kinase/tetratricopeptide (TPR) repeat protein